MGVIKTKNFYKKPAFWVLLTIIFVLISATIWFMFNPFVIKITQLKDGRDYSNIFNNIDAMTVVQKDAQYVVSNEEDVRLILDKLQDIKIKSIPVSEDKYDDYTAYNHIPLNDVTLCFDDDFTKLWINYHDDVTYYYSIINSDIAKSVFEIAKDGKKTNFELCNISVECNRTYVDVKIKKFDLLSQNPEIEIEIKNNGDTKYTYGESFNIKRIAEDGEVSCSTRGRVSNLLLIIVSPNESCTEKYVLNGYDFSKIGKYKFEADNISIYFEIKE